MPNVNCQQCGKQVEVTDNCVGTVVNCSDCGGEIIVSVLDVSAGIDNNSNNEKGKELQRNSRYKEVPFLQAIILLFIMTLLVNLSVFIFIVVRSIHGMMFIVGWNFISAVLLILSGVLCEREDTVKSFWAVVRVALGVLLLVWTWKLFGG